MAEPVSVGKSDIPKSIVLDYMTQASETSQREVAVVVMSVLRMVAVGQKQRALDEEHKTALRCIQEKAVEAVRATKNSVHIIKGFASSQGRARISVGSLLRISSKRLTQPHGQKRVNSALAILSSLDEATGKSCANAMGLSLAKWGELSDLLSVLRADLDKSADKYTELIKELDANAKSIKKMSLAATCGIILVGIPVAAVSVTPAVGACIAALVGVAAAGALLTFGCTRAKGRARKKKETAQVAAAEAEEKAKASRVTQDVLIQFADAVAKEFDFVEGLKEDITPMSEASTDDKAAYQKHSRAALVWTQFRRCETAEEVLQLAKQLQEVDEAGSLCDRFDEDSIRCGVLQAKITEWGNSLDDLVKKISTLTAPPVISTE